MKQIIYRTIPILTYTDDALAEVIIDVQKEYRLLQIVKVDVLPTTVNVMLLVEKK